MSRNQKRFPYSLDSGKIRKLSDEELRMILRAADEIIATGGRSMLTKILKGSKDKKILEYQLDKSPAYGAFSELSAEEVSNRVDWAIEHNYLAVEYSKKLPLLEEWKTVEVKKVSGKIDGVINRIRGKNKQEQE